MSHYFCDTHAMMRMDMFVWQDERVNVRNVYRNIGKNFAPSKIFKKKYNSTRHSLLQEQFDWLFKKIVMHC